MVFYVCIVTSRVISAIYVTCTIRLELKETNMNITRGVRCLSKYLYHGAQRFLRNGNYSNSTNFQGISCGCSEDIERCLYVFRISLESLCCLGGYINNKEILLS